METKQQIAFPVVWSNGFRKSIRGCRVSFRRANRVYIRHLQVMFVNVQSALSQRARPRHAKYFTLATPWRMLGYVSPLTP